MLLLYMPPCQGSTCLSGLTWKGQALFVFWKINFEKLFFKFFYIYLSLEKLVNKKYFPVNRNTFRSTENTFQLKKNLVWFPEKYFPFWLCLFSGKWFPENHFPNILVFVCYKKSWSTENTFESKENLTWFSRKCFPGKFRRKTLSESCEKFRNVIIYWLYQIWSSNFWLLYIIYFEYLFFNFIS